MHELRGPHDPAAERLAQGLVAEADAEERHRRSGGSSSRLIPASSGVPGPGEITMRSGRRARASSTLSASLRTTFTSAPSSPRYW